MPHVVEKRVGLSLLVLGVIAAVAACGGDDSSGTTTGTGDDGGPGGSGDGAVGADGSQGGDDGSTGDGGHDDGTPWRYTVETAPDGVMSALSLARTPTGLGAAFATTGGDLTVATTTGGAWTNDTATGNSAGSGVRYAVAPDGTPWVLLGSTVLHKDGSGWVTETLSSDNNFQQMVLAIGADGTPWIAASGYVFAQPNGVYLLKHSGSTWTSEFAVAPPTNKLVVSLALAVSGGAPHIAWIAQDGSVHLTTPNAGSGYTDEAVGSGQYDGGLAAAVDEGGTLHLAYQANGRNPSLVTKVNGTWQVDQVTTDRDSEGVMRLVSAPDGSLAMAWDSHSYGERVAFRTAGGVWSTQSVYGYCTDTQYISIAFDASSKLHIALNCSTPGVPWVRSAPFPADYVTTCKSLAASLCQKAYSCCGDPNAQECCISTTQGGSNCSNPEWYCETSTIRDVCADATQDPALVTACNAAAGQAVCTTTPKPGATAPDACASFF